MPASASAQAPPSEPTPASGGAGPILLGLLLSVLLVLPFHCSVKNSMLERKRKRLRD